MTRLVSTLAALPYELARWPLAVLDRSLADKLPEAFGPRVALDRAIGTADELVGALLGHTEIARRGSDRIEHSDRVLAAHRLEDLAASRQEQADETLDDARRTAARQRETAQHRAETGLASADATEARGAEVAAATAAATAQAKKDAADRRAAQREAAAERKRAGMQDAAATRKRAATKKAAVKARDAATAEAAASDARADAERLDDLAAARKAKRRAGREAGSD